MRNAVIMIVLAGSTLAIADGAQDPKPKPIDVKPVLDKLEVYKDDVGNYYVAPRLGAFTDDEEKWLFLGDGKSMYQQRVIGSGANGNEHDWTMWGPRAKGAGAELHLEPDKQFVRCKLSDEGKRPLTRLNPDQTAGLLKRAKFFTHLWQRQAHFLARDDDGVYYFVDQLIDGKGFRVFVGPKGALKQLSMTNMASDTAGEIFATKGGQLKIIATSDNKAFWIKGSKKVELTVVPVAENHYLVYRELGIYGQLGALCDDQ